MTEIIANLKTLPLAVRVLLIVLLAGLAHLTVLGLKWLSRWLLTLRLENEESTEANFTKRFPKFATIITILVSGLTFVVYFLAIGLILQDFSVKLTTYLASASVIGLAVGFGAQGFVQDVVIGLTLIFSDTLNIEDVVEISDKVGRVEKIGLRFTTLVNLHGQKIFIPNRNIGTINQFRGGCIRAYVDFQMPPQIDEKRVFGEIKSIAMGMYQQHKSIILVPPEPFGVKEIDSGKWRYFRIKFRIWPGQNAIIETTFKNRVMAALKKDYPEYAEWMITVTYKVE